MITALVIIDVLVFGSMVYFGAWAFLAWALGRKR